jgi:hypothetical protein
MARQPMPKALSPLQSDLRSYTSELSVVSRVAVELKLLGSWRVGVVFGEEGVVRVVEKFLELLEFLSWRLSELVSKEGKRKGTWSSPVTKVAAVMVAADLL